MPATPYPLRVEYLHKFSGSQTKQLRYFKKNLTQALEEPSPILRLIKGYYVTLGRRRERVGRASKPRVKRPSGRRSFRPASKRAEMGALGV